MANDTTSVVVLLQLLLYCPMQFSSSVIHTNSAVAATAGVTTIR